MDLGAFSVSLAVKDIAASKAFYEKLKQTNPKAEYYIYEGAGHAFHDYSRPAFNEQASRTAWGRTLEFFKKNL